MASGRFPAFRHGPEVRQAFQRMRNKSGGGLQQFARSGNSIHALAKKAALRTAMPTSDPSEVQGARQVARRHHLAGHNRASKRNTVPLSANRDDLGRPAVLPEVSSARASRQRRARGFRRPLSVSTPKKVRPDRTDTSRNGIRISFPCVRIKKAPALRAFAGSRGPFSVAFPDVRQLA